MRGHIRKRGKSWQVVVELERDPITGKRKQKGFTIHGTKKEAERFLAEKLNEINRGEYINLNNLTLGEYLARWLGTYAKSNVAPSTYRSYVSSIQTHIKPKLGNIPLDKIKPMHIQAYYTWVQSEDGPAVSSTTALYHHRILHEALQHAVKWQLLPRTPTEAVEPPIKRRYKAAILTIEQFQLLLDATRDTPIHMPVLLAGTMGMRRGEICGLRWGDINFEQKVLYIQNALQRLNGQLRLVPTKTKGSERAVALLPTTIDGLKHQKKRQAEFKLMLGQSFQEKGFVCTWEDGRPLDPDYVTKAFKKTLQKLNLPDVRFHDLRHTHATLLLQEKIPIKVVSERLGHSSTRITQDIYSHVLPHMQEEAAEALERLLIKKGTN